MIDSFLHKAQFKESGYSAGLTDLVAAILDLYTGEAVAFIVSEGHNESMHAMVIQGTAAIWCWHLQASKDGAHLTILSCIANPPAGQA